MNELVTAHAALARWANTMPEREFLHQPAHGRLRVTTCREAEDQARRMAAALRALGMKPGDKVAILAKNSAEWVLADLAIAMAGLVSVPIYPTASADTVAYIIGHSEAKAIFVGKLDEPDAIGAAIPDTLPTIAFPYPTAACRHDWQELVDNAEPLPVPNEPAPEDVMTILYTSGSTGRPKGVVISYRAYVYGCTAALGVMGIGTEDRVLSYLPLSHVTERMALIGPSICAGAKIFFVESLRTFVHDLKTAKPTGFGSVPRLWVKFQAGIHSKIPPARLRLLLAIPLIGRIVARRIRDGMGFEDCTKFASGSAPISPHTLRWYRKLGIDIGEGWGMTETSGLSCANIPFEARRLGTIGVPVDGTELKISAEGELLIRSPGLFTEYFKQPELTAEAFTKDGFFHTGDRAEWDEERVGYRITGRVKDIFKTAKGKYVAPVPIESRLSSNPLLEQVCVLGAVMPAPVAIVVLSDAAQHLPKENGEKSLGATLADTNKHLESHERLSGVIIVDEEWTTGNGLLTPTLKIKRDDLEARYGSMADRKPGKPVAWENEL
ncbi:MAG TPA: AMP-binding protein [Woeseiaceae bacterium]|nr:AMP-binding protein [Woeseiaceae bacterium]